jgi:hypothetical protein
MKHPLALLLKRLNLEQLGVLFGYLRDSGWFRCLCSCLAVDAQGGPLPWYSYPAIHLIEARLGARPAR